VIPAPFTYQRAGSVDEALSLAAEGGDDAKFLAGGHSLLPLMKLRLAVPEVLVDIGRLSELSYVREENGHIAVGALTTHHDVANSGLLGGELPLLAHAAGQVGDPQIRHRGTIGGSLVHSDPAGDLPAVILVLDATLVARGPAGTREIPAGEFFQGLFETALEPGELLTEIRIPSRPRPGGPSRSSPSGPSTGRSSAPPCRATRWRWSTWDRRRCGPARSSGRWPKAPRRPTRPPTPRTGRARPRTSTPTVATASTWRGSWSAAGWPRRSHGPETGGNPPSGAPGSPRPRAPGHVGGFSPARPGAA